MNRGMRFDDLTSKGSEKIHNFDSHEKQELRCMNSSTMWMFTHHVDCKTLARYCTYKWISQWANMRNVFAMAKRIMEHHRVIEKLTHELPGEKSTEITTITYLISVYLQTPT